MKTKYIDTSNRRYYEIGLFFSIIKKKYLDKGYSVVDANANAYDAIELRFGIGKDRARAIIIGTNSFPVEQNRIKNAVYANNSRLIELLKMINDEIANR